MKIGVYADAHFSLNSSIILGSKGTLSGRLSYLINSFGWMYKQFEDRKVDMIVDLGDLTDSYMLRAEEITAITDALSLKKSDIPEYHILGNHERLDEAGVINSVNFIENYHSHKLIKDVTTIGDVTFIPYSKYNDGDFDNNKSKIAFSHIDIFGSDTGGWKLKSGLTPSYLTSVYQLVLNGHIHNGSWVIPKKVMNVGSISGQNFSSKSVYWHPSIAILDTDTLEVELIENPHALRFVQIEAGELSVVINKLSKLESNISYGVQVKVPLVLS